MDTDRSGISPDTVNVKKIVLAHSDFDLSPFDLWYYHPGIPRRFTMTVYNWFKGHVTIEDLGRVWFSHNEPTPIRISGHEIKSSLMQSGCFTVAICDAIMRFFNNLDDWMYDYHNSPDEIHNRWRHFLPASFAKAVLDGHDYLQSESVRAHFTGSHIKYAIPDCGTIIIPVLFEGKWSCYFWDFEKKDIAVLDPMFMNRESFKSELRHCDVVTLLHNALFACKDHFFSGWDVDGEGWSTTYCTNIGPRCKMVNSGLYVVHYARAFDGESLSWKLRAIHESNLGEPRADLLYFLITMQGNGGYTPVDLLEELDVFSQRRLGN